MKRRIFRVLFVLMLVLSLSLVTAVPVSAAALTGVSDTPTSTTAGATTTHTIAFTTASALTVATTPDRIVITFPGSGQTGEFDASGAQVDGATTTPSTTDPILDGAATKTVVTLKVEADESAGAFSIVLTGIKNTQTAGTSYTVTVETQDGDNSYATIDGPTVSSAFSITPDATDSYSLNSPADIAVGSRAAYIVTRYDQYSNVVTSGAETVYMYTSSASANAKFYDAASNGS
ncbi:MAG: hypothetical protein JSU76_01875, partial [Dehalococcoidia bacterium]